MDRRMRIDPTLTITPRSLLTAMDQLKDQVTSLAQGRHTVNRFTDLAKDRLETVWNELGPEETRELDGWLSGQIQAGTGAAKIKWDLVRGVFEAVRDARDPTLCAPFGRPLSTAVSDISLRRSLIGFSQTRGTTETRPTPPIFAKIPAGWPQEDPVLAVETTPLAAELLRSAPVSGPWRPAGFVWIGLGVTVLFAFGIGGGYWLTKQTPPPPATTDLAIAPPIPRLVVGLPALTDQPSPDRAAAVPTVAQLPVLGPSQPLGLPPINHGLGLNLPHQWENRHL
jgi:hypothetical protein